MADCANPVYAELQLRTSHEWYHMHSVGIVIGNADGWRDLCGEGDVAAKYWWFVPIAQHEYEYRVAKCTCRRLSREKNESDGNKPDPYPHPYGTRYTDVLTLLLRIEQSQGYQKMHDYCKSSELDEWEKSFCDAYERDSSKMRELLCRINAHEDSLAK